MVQHYKETSRVQPFELSFFSRSRRHLSSHSRIRRPQNQNSHHHDGPLHGEHRLHQGPPRAHRNELRRPWRFSHHHAVRSETHDLYQRQSVLGHAVGRQRNLLSRDAEPPQHG